MAVQDDLRRLSQLDGIFLGWITPNNFGFGVTSWHKGRLQQANDSSWVFRSMSAEGTIVGFQLGFPAANWTSVETPSSGITVLIPLVVSVPSQITLATVSLQQQLPQEMTN